MNRDPAVAFRRTNLSRLNGHPVTSPGSRLIGCSSPRTGRGFVEQLERAELRPGHPQQRPDRRHLHTESGRDLARIEALSFECERPGMDLGKEAQGRYAFHNPDSAARTIPAHE